MLGNFPELLVWPESRGILGTAYNMEGQIKRNVHQNALSWNLGAQNRPESIHGENNIQRNEMATVSSHGVLLRPK